MKVPSDVAVQVIDCGIYYYNRFGVVNCLFYPSVDHRYIKGKYGKKQLCFKWEDLGVKFFLTHKEAYDKAEEYKARVTKYVSLDTLEKICKLRYPGIFYEVRHLDIDEVYVEEYSYFDKNDLAFINVIETDSDYERYYEETYPLSEYGKTWALTKNELEVKK